MLRIAVVCLCFVVAACENSPQPSQSNIPTRKPGSPVTEPIAATMDPPTLWGEFGSNEIAADQKYKGKRVKLTGSVDVVRSDEKGTFAGFTVFASTAVSPARLKTMSEQEKKWFRDGYPPQVICYLSADAVKAAGQLKAGASAEIIGQVAGRKADSDVPKGYVVILDGCTIGKIVAKAK